MNKKMFIIAFVLIVLGTAAIIGLKIAPHFYKQEIKLPDEIASVQEFIVDNSMSVIRHDGIWSSRDDDFYPVDNDKVENLLAQLKQAVLSASECKEMPSGTADIVFKTIPDTALFSSYDENGGQYVEIMQEKNCMALSEKIDIPDQPYQWFMQPLFPFSDNDIEEIYGMDPSHFSFANLIFYQVTRSNDFEEWDSRKFKIITSGGIIIEMNIFARGHSYWMSVALNTTPMPTKGAAAYIKNNGFLFDGWYFELPQPEGSRLFDNAGLR